MSVDRWLPNNEPLPLTSIFFQPCGLTYKQHAMTASSTRFLLFSLLMLPTVLVGQERECGSSEVNNLMLMQPEKAALAEQLNRDATDYTSAYYGQQRSVVRVIPIVFHIIHNDGTENISKEQILDAVRIINEDFRGQNSDLSMIIEEFAGITADSEIEFRLAKKDPNGNCTDGITRTKSALTFSAGENVKDLISWNTARYLNVWVVDNIESGAGGYAYYPGNAPSQANEGIVVRHSQCGSIGTSGGSNFSARTLSHEIGHYLNLKHVWGDSNDNAQPDNCNDDDNVGDTPNTIGSEQTCDLNQVTCGSLDNVQNYMDYSTCARMFTNGQKARMQAALQSSAGQRNNLWTGTNLNNTGTSDGFSAPCTPNVEFAASNTLGCEGTQVQFTDHSWGADEDASWQWNWSFPGGTPASSTDQNPTVTYAQAGVFTASLTISTGEGSDTQTQNGLITIGEFGNGQPAPFSEGIEASSFPNNTSDPELSWTVEAGSGTTWQRTTTASTSGSASVRINLRSIDSGTLNSLVSPAINMSDVNEDDARITFKVAHAARNADGHSERLRVYVSIDCGETWNIRYTRSGNSLSTTSATVIGTFVPNANQWREESVNLSSVAGEEHVLFKFEALSDGQNYLYLDDINITASPSAINESNGLESISIVPNPVNDNAVLQINSAMATRMRVVVTDAIGRVVNDSWIDVNAGQNSIPVQRMAAIETPGVYMVAVFSGAHRSTVKLVK
jgi:PKD repeat protein